MMTRIAHVREPKRPAAGDRLLTEDELEVVACGCALIEPGPKGNPVPVSN